MAVFDSYSLRSGEKFFNEIYKSSKQINSQKTSQPILFMCNNNNNNNNNDLLSVFPYNGSLPDKTTTTISKEIVRKL
jgi:hypothetical protein